jgi:hypothetical protein
MFGHQLGLLLLAVLAYKQHLIRNNGYDYEDERSLAYKEIYIVINNTKYTFEDV